MNYRVKGYAANPVVAGIACVVVGAVIGGGVVYWYMSTHQGGLGDGSDAGIVQEETAPSEAPAVESIVFTTEPVTEPSTEPPTMPVTETGSFIKVSVTGNQYMYKYELYTLDEFIGIVRNNPGLQVRIQDDGASIRAYEALIGALQELDADYVESNS